MTLKPFSKPHATAIDRIAHLRSKGLVVQRPQVAARKIEMIGYERLRIYFLSRRQLSIIGRPFVPGTSYKDIISLYKCDMLLRVKCFEAVGHFELLLRNAMSEALSHAHGSHPYFDKTAFKDAGSNLEALKYFTDVCQRTKDHRAKHYRSTYGEPIMPPIWTMKEFMTFGATLQILQHLSGPLRSTIAKNFGVPKDTIFIDWVKCLVDLRNICAHHDRLFNRSFQKQPSTLTSAALPTANKAKLKATLECLDYMLGKRGANSNVTDEVQKIINRFPQMLPAEAGY
jgi:abortive infection bacteriophage resistance protein